MLGELDPEGKRNILERAEDPSSRIMSRGELGATGLCLGLTGAPVMRWGASGAVVAGATLNTGTLLLLWRGGRFGSSRVVLSIP